MAATQLQTTAILVTHATHTRTRRTQHTHAHVKLSSNIHPPKLDMEAPALCLRNAAAFFFLSGDTRRSFFSGDTSRLPQHPLSVAMSH